MFFLSGPVGARKSDLRPPLIQKAHTFPFRWIGTTSLETTFFSLAGNKIMASFLDRLREAFKIGAPCYLKSCERRFGKFAPFHVNIYAKGKYLIGNF
jgi:hypothetical protein